MIQGCQHLRFTFEAGEPFGILRQLRGHYLDGDLAVEVRVPGSKDLAHSTLADGREDFVRAEFVACCERHRIDLPSVLGQEADGAWLTANPAATFSNLDLKWSRFRKRIPDGLPTTQESKGTAW